MMEIAESTPPIVSSVSIVDIHIQKKHKYLDTSMEWKTDLAEVESWV